MLAIYLINRYYARKHSAAVGEIAVDESALE